jgi:hypothetical protein
MSLYLCLWVWMVMCVCVCRHVFMCVWGVLCVRVFFICRSNEFPDKNGLSIKYSLKTVSQ